MLGESKLLTLPCGKPFRLDRSRSDGILSQDELAFCTSEGISVAYDPAQCGWVLAQSVDDLFTNEVTDRAHPRAGRVRRSVGLHLHLRPWEMGDAPRLADLLNDHVLWATLPEPFPDPVTVELAQSLIEISMHGTHHQVHAVIYDDVPIGQVRLQYDTDATGPRLAELSYWIGRAYWGQGFASAVVPPFVRQCFAEDVALMSLCARVKTGNVASLRVLGKAGFQDEGPAERSWRLLRRDR